jgi:hypothetical protein
LQDCGFYFAVNYAPACFKLACSATSVKQWTILLKPMKSNFKLGTLGRFHRDRITNNKAAK